MSGVTDADREKAIAVMWPIATPWGGGKPYRDLNDLQREVVDRLAAALAEEREQARAPFRLLPDAWEEQARDWYYDNRHTHDHGIDYCAGYEEGWDHAAKLLRDTTEADA